jgi:hypothetical protein
VDFRHAWSLWPGQVHVDDLRVRVQDRNVQFVVDLPSADVTVRLVDLMRREFHATQVRGSGLSFRFRHRVEPESADRPSVLALPPIPGFQDPPLREAGPPTAPVDDAHYRLWTVHIEDVDVGVREVWIQMFRYQGGGRALGAFRLKPARRVWVGPAELRLERGTMETGPQEVATAARGTIQCTVDDFDVRTVQGLEPFRFISARANLDLQASNLGAVNFLAGPDRAFEVQDGSGALAFDASIDHGTLTPESWLTYRTNHVGVVLSPSRYRIDSELALSARGPGGEARPGSFSPNGILSHVEARNVRLGTPTECQLLHLGEVAFDGHAAVAQSGTIEADARGAVDETSVSWGSFQLAGEHASFSSSWNGALASTFFRATDVKLRSSGGAPKGWQADLGQASVSGDLQLSGDGLRGPLKVEADHIAARVGKTSLAGDVVAQFNVSSKDASHRTADVSGVVQARRVTIRNRDREVQDWWANVAFRKLHLDTRQNFDFSGNVGAHFRDALPALTVLAANESLPKWVPETFPLRSLELELHVERVCRWTDVQIVQGSGGPLKAAGRLQFAPGDSRGAVLFELAAFHPASLGIDFAGDQAHKSLFAGHGWLEKHLGELAQAATRKRNAHCTVEPSNCD